MKKTILWLVVARSGSKSIPDKNIKSLGNVPLLNFRISTAKQSKHSSDTWISTDSESYAKIAEDSGAIVPFIRPSILASDSSSSMDVVIHAMNHANSIGLFYDFIGLLEPTSPFITTNQLDDALGILITNKSCNSIVSVRESRPNTIFIQDDNQLLNSIYNNIYSQKNLTRQNFPKQITPSGGIYISRWENMLNLKSFYTPATLAFEVDEISGIEIDEKIDWDFAEFLMEKKIINIHNYIK